jgi:hypothetical protein
VAKEAKIGTDFEKLTRETLEYLQGNGRLSYVRLFDTKSARGKFLPEQPGDFIVASPNGGHLVECKASQEHQSLRSCLSDNVKPHQAAAHRLWARAGQPCWFLFHSVMDSQLELWPGKIVGEARATGTVLKKEDALIVSLDTLTDLLYNTFGLRGTTSEW